MREIAIFSTWNKEGTGTLARALMGFGMEIVATGKTRTHLESEGVKVSDISDLTHEPERFNGRLKTLHHLVLGGILFRPGHDESEWPYDFRVGAVVCNFYPFLEKADDIDNLDALAEWVDIGGPTMVRAAAKNYKHVWVFTRPEQYTRFIVTPEEQRERLHERLALEAFEEVSKLDEAIVFHFQSRQPWAGGGKLHYGENPHQKASFLPNRRAGVRVLGNVSYNNVRDAEAAFRFVSPFAGPAVAVIKHQTLCGAAVGLKSANADRVFDWAWEGDPISRYGGILGLNFVPSPAITEILKKKFLEVLVLPRTDESEKWAHKLHEEKPRLRIFLLDASAFEGNALPVTEIHQGALGRLTQDADTIDVGESDVHPGQLEMNFGQWAAACSKSNAMVLTGWSDSDGVSYMAGAGQGQPNRVDALKLLALPRARDFAERRGVKLEEMVCFSDAFLPFDDCLKILKDAGVNRIVQPGGSKSDEQIADTASKLGMEMKISERRHFWH
jgi:phosphoribosylaminoimidazolecarboxamide formyltransferase/IMP cyclohydrolase